MQERDFNFEESAVHYAVFDTHKHIKELQACGFDEKQAEVLVKSLLHSRDYDLERLATKEQVNLLQKDIKTLEMQMVTYVGIMKWSATLLVTVMLGVIGILVKVW
ncbi:MAG: hypothetical protein ACRY3E_06150 [Candidatus Lariskella arthropodorum]